MSEPTAPQLLSVLRSVHERFTEAVTRLGDEGATQPSYDDDWTVAQVASHLGSGSEIFRAYLDAGAKGEAPPGSDFNQPVWDAWNAKAPTEQVHDSIASNASLLEAAEALTEEERTAWRLDLFGMELDLAALLRMRLSEYAVHTWDVTVVLDPASTILADAVEPLVDNVAMVAGWGGKPTEQQVSVEVRTTEPERAFRLDLGPSGVSLTPSLDDTSAAELALPAEAFVRLVYGRLDPDHIPDSVSGRGVDLDVLRAAFPGL